MSYFVNTQSIRRWAQERLDARSRLPQLIRRLVHATVSQLSGIDFPANESTGRSGFDGFVDCSSGNAWVPAGRSGWELSVEKGIKDKANSDLAKRTEAVTKDERLQTTFVFLTPRHWEKKEEWAKNATSLGDWKEVRAFDADDVEQWVEQAPAVGVWFAQLASTRPTDIDDVESRWLAIAASTTPPLIPAVFLASRDPTRGKLVEWFTAPPSCLTLASRSPTEIIDFACATIIALEEPQRCAVLSRTAIVESSIAWKSLRDSPAGLILIVEPSFEVDAVEISRAVMHGHHVLTTVPLNRHAVASGLELEHASEFHLTQALEECGLSPVSAEQVARASAGSLAILKRRLARHPASYRPQWTNTASSEVVRACLLLGGWDGGNSADQTAIERLSGMQYSDVESQLMLLSTVRDPLLLHAASHWRVISKDEAWDVLGNRVTAASLARFAALATEILSDDDPKYSLAPEERITASMKGHVPKYSGTLKKHVAETVALLGAVGETIDAASSFNTAAALHRIVAGVLSVDATWHRWASLGQRLSMLAEASPDAFLAAVRADLQSNRPQFLSLLADEGDPLFGGCNHAGLLWALETLAWSPKHVLEACKLLLALDALDPGGKWSNRPRASLGEILSCWMPHTTASTDDRIKILEALIASNPNAAWNLLLSLLPQPMGGFSTPTHRPYWRDWAASWQRGVPYEDLRKYVRLIAKKLIALAAVDPNRWHTVVSHIAEVPQDVLPDVISGLNALTLSGISEEERRLVSDELSERINLHRHHEEAQWALPQAMIDQLEAVQSSLRPQSAVLRHAWLFAQWPDRFYMREGSVADHDKAIDEARKEALTEVVAENGFQSVLDLAKNVQSPFTVGRTLAALTGDQYSHDVVPDLLVEDDYKVNTALGFVSHRFHPDNWEWADRMLERCESESARAWLLVMLPFTPAAWTRAASAGNETASLYWQRSRAFAHDLNDAALNEAVERLVEVKRVGRALDILGMALHNKQQLSVETLCAPLDALLTLKGEEFKSQFGTGTSHDIGEVFASLQASPEIDEGRLMALEWQYLKLLDGRHGQPPKTLHKRLASDPAFFVEVLSLCFKSQDDDREVKPTEHEVFMATQAYRLLHDWHHIPGTEQDGSIHEPTLRQWFVETRRLAEECGRLGICDSQIGQMLSCAPADPDGTWPVLSVRTVAEEIASERLASGWHCGIKNSRGVVCRGKGGNQERELSSKYKGLADAIRFDFPFVARVLNGVAESYLEDARHWDEQDRWEE